MLSDLPVLFALVILMTACKDISECPLTVDEVCGSDGKTYRNKCVFGVEKCRLGDDDLEYVKPGKCIEGEHLLTFVIVFCAVRG